MPNEQGAAPEQKLHATRAALDSLVEKMVAEFGAEIAAHLLVEAAGRARDIFQAEVSRARSDWGMESPGGRA